MLLSSAQKSSLLCSKLCSQNQAYALELTVLYLHFLTTVLEKVTAVLEYLDLISIKCELVKK